MLSKDALAEVLRLFPKLEPVMRSPVADRAAARQRQAASDAASALHGCLRDCKWASAADYLSLAVSKRKVVLQRATAACPPPPLQQWHAVLPLHLAIINRAPADVRAILHRIRPSTAVAAFGFNSWFNNSSGCCVRWSSGC